MMRRIVDVLARLDPRLVIGAMLLVPCLLAFEGWVLVIRQPLAEFMHARTNRAALAASLQQSPDAAAELARMSRELQELSEKLSGQLRLPASDDQIAAALMAALDQSASKHGLRLSGLKPGEKKQVSGFEEVSFEVSASGAYLQLCDWMLDFERTLGNNASVTEFDMKSMGEGGRVALSMNVALYRPLKPAGGGR